MPTYPYKDYMPTIAEGVYIDEAAKVIGKVAIGKDSSIWPMTVLRGDVNKIVIGERTNIQDGTIVHCSPDCEFFPGGFPTIIGDNVSVGHKAILHGCKIMDNCLIGMGAIVLDGAELEPWVMVGAGSLVPPGKKLVSGFLYVGSPVKQIRELTEKEKHMLTYNVDCYVHLKDDLHIKY